MNELIALQAHELIAAITTGELDPHEVWRTYRQRALDDQFGAVVWIHEAHPPVLDPSLPLAGVPFGIKDSFCVEGVPSRAASAILANYRPPYTAHIVERLQMAGAAPLIRTNMDEFGMGGSTENSSLFVTRNPWNPAYVPGGSSGGSAAAIAAGIIPWALGTDTGGSIRQPAGFCGIVGLKPTYGVCSRRGMIAFASSLDCPGPMARSVTDCALLFEHMYGEDSADSTSIAWPGQFRVPEREDLRGLRVGVVPELAGDGLDEAVAAALAATINRLVKLGAEVVETPLPHIEHAIAAYYIIASAEASTNLARFDGVRFGARASGETIDQTYTATRSRYFGREVKRRIMLGTFALSAGYSEAYYGSAQRVRTLLCQDFAAALSGVDFLITPTAPTPAYRLGTLIDDPVQMYLNDICTVAVSLAGLPALSLPMGVSNDGLPLGLQLIGATYAEPLLFSVGRLLEARTPMPPRPWEA